MTFDLKTNDVTDMDLGEHSDSPTDIGLDKLCNTSCQDTLSRTECDDNLEEDTVDEITEYEQDYELSDVS